MKFRNWGFIAVALALLSGPFLSLPAAAVERVDIRAWQHPGFGRLVFDWPTPVGYETRLDGTRLEIHFKRRLAGEIDGGDLDGIAKKLPTYVAAAVIGADGKTAILTLNAPFRHKVFASDKAVVVDLFPLSAPGPNSANAVGDLPVVAVRVGEHESYSRLVFDWRRQVDYQVKQEGNHATIHFSADARLALGELRRDPPRHLRGAVQPAGREAALRLTLPEGARLRHFRSGLKVVLDILAGAGPPMRLGQGGVTPKPVLQASTAELAALGAIAPAAGLSSFATEPVVVAPKASRGGLLPSVAASLVKGKQGVSLRFDWEITVPAAVFRRAGYMWVVFDHPAPVDLSAVEIGARSVISDFRRIPVPGVTAVRFLVLPGFSPVVRHEGTSWIIDLRQRPNDPVAAISVAVETSGLRGPRMFLPALRPGRVIEITDPEVGDRLYVAALPGVGQGVVEGRDMAKFSLLKSAQGIAVEVRDEAVVVERLDNGVEVVEPQGGLYISPESDKIAAQTGGGVEREKPLFDFIGWGDFERPFLDVKHEHNQAIAKASPGRRALFRLGLARYYVARGFVPEGLGILEVMGVDDESVEADVEFRALRGVARLLVGRTEEAAADLSLPQLAGDPEGELWRAALIVSRGEWASAARAFGINRERIRAYPPHLRRYLARLGAEATLAGGFLDQAVVFIALFDESAISTGDHAHAAYLRARLLLAEGKLEEAKKLFADLESSTDRLTRARAGATLTELMLQSNEITLKAAADRFDALRYAWRGGSFEVELLSRLGDMYIEEGDYRNGLTTFKNLSANFPKESEAAGITLRMRAAFRHIYMESGGDELEPVTAIALFDEFRELTPSGAEGNKMIRKLADRLVAVDLLDRAAGLLEHQVRFRLTGAEKQKVSMELAVIRLLDNNPAGAVAALDMSDDPGLPAAEVRERRLLLAQALTQLSREKEALELLSAVNTPEAERQRAEIFWRQRDWQNAAMSFEGLLKGRPEKGGKLTREESREAVNWAISLSLLGDEIALLNVKERFAAAMKGGSLEEAFALVTSEIGVGGSYESIISQIGSIDAMQATMASYRERLHKTSTAVAN